MKYINQPLIINTNITLDEANECYFEALVEVEKLKKEFNIYPPGKFFTLRGVNGTKKSRISSLQSLTLE